MQEVTGQAAATSEPMGYPRYEVNWQDGTGAAFRFTVDADGIFSATFMEPGNYRAAKGDADIATKLCDIFSFDAED